VPTLAYRLASALCGALISLSTVSVTSNGLGNPNRSAHLAIRKGPDAGVPCEPAVEIVTWGSLVSLHFDEILPLSDEEPSPDAMNRLVRDRVTGENARMAPELLGLVREVARERPPARVEVISGYRSWKLNEMLRKKGRNVAEHSQHTLGHALDFRVEGLSSKDLAARIEQRKWNGGLAFYPGDADRFVHADTGPKRRWRGR